MKHLFAALALGAAALPAVSATTLAYWDFNSDDGQVSTGSLLPSEGGGTMALIGGAQGLFTSGSPGDPAGFPLDSGWSVGGFPAQGTASATAGLAGLVSTVGYHQIVLSFDHKTQPSGNKWFAVEATSDAGDAWARVATFAVPAADTWSTASFDLTAALPGLANQAGFGFRVVAIFEPGTLAYQAVEAGYNGDFGLVIDRLTVQATPVPEAGSIALALAGFAGVAGIAGRQARRGPCPS
ncbi:hypothetical protein GTZ97_02000 [Aquabacterium fontiphilum]|uniref:hypothetical protein n=1 Tax=Aquabacterium fontiphilum TaxID=450365 RepID=UPI00137671F7|nr:hypothetical protein [Aquabacterium fontiphilum]NBD19446.1 hypothetical protein [Aquabacterium fontiphilum]